MFKLFATMCILVNGIPECTTYSDNKDEIFKTLVECEQRAEVRFYETMGGIMAYDIPFESITIGCKGEENS
jgi:hypothetical protein